jgi:hypothetical protein
MVFLQGNSKTCGERLQINITEVFIARLSMRKGALFFIIGRGLARAPVAERLFVLPPRTVREQS